MQPLADIEHRAARAVSQVVQVHGHCQVGTFPAAVGQLPESEDLVRGVDQRIALTCGDAALVGDPVDRGTRFCQRVDHGADRGLPGGVELPAQLQPSAPGPTQEQGVVRARSLIGLSRFRAVLVQPDQQLRAQHPGLPR